MKLCIEWHFLRKPLLFLISSGLITSALLQFSHVFWQQQQQLLKQQQVKKNLLIDQYASKQKLQNYLATAYPQFKKLQQMQHFPDFTPQDSRYWASLDNIQQQLSIPAFSATLSTPLELSNPLMSNSDLSISQTPVDLKLGLLHGQSFYDYLQRLRVQYPLSRLQIKRCHLQRQKNTKNYINITAQCQLNFHYLFISIKTSI